MNFLQICQAVSRDVRYPGGATYPTAVTSQTGKLANIVSFVDDAWSLIQNVEDYWRWMRVGFTISTTEDDDSYAFGDCTDSLTSSAITRFARWLIDDPEDPPRIYLTSSGVGTETWMSYCPWEAFKSVYRIGTQNSGYPIHITVDPQNNIVIGPKPNGIYTITSEYMRSAQTLSADADIPEMPTHFHPLIQYETIKKFALIESAQELMNLGVDGASPLWAKLRREQLPPPRNAGPMA